MPSQFDRVLSAVLALGMITIAGTLVHREFFAQTSGPVAVRDDRPPEFLPRWKEILSSGIETGSPGASTVLIEFVDFECPACKAYSSTLSEIKSHYGNDLSVVLVHLPLAMHRHARSAARAAECAREQSRFAEFHDLVYAKQDSLGLKSWASFAGEAEIGDTLLFSRCVNRSDFDHRIDAGIKLAQQLQIGGTPTVIVNGWRFFSPPRKENLVRAIDAIRLGRGRKAIVAAVSE